MTDDQLSIRPAQARKPLHEDFTPETISLLVDEFYGEVRKDARLGPIFDARLSGKWGPHLIKMKQFWSSVLLKSGTYKGRPVPAHMGLKEVESDDFQRWLGLFRPVAQRLFSPEAAKIVIAAAERIAQSLWLVMFGDPFNRPPAWLKNEPAAEETTS